MQQSDFGSLFKKFRLRSGFATLRGFGDVLSEKGFLFEDSLFSHWQKNTRVPKNRRLLLTIVEIFLEKGGITSIRDVNLFLESVSQRSLTEQETTYFSEHKPKLFSLLNCEKKVFDFISSTSKSKKIIRAGWGEKGIANPESVAEHSFHLSVMAMIFADHFGLDREKLIKMAVLHDLCEVVTGDIIWTRGTVMDIEKKSQKEKAELAGITKIFEIIDQAKEYKALFEEMIEGKSPEAKIFWQLDKLEMAFQAMLYEKEHQIDLDEFFVSADLHIFSPFLRKIFKQILKARPKIKK